ncbi:MAG: peroxiredoxin [Ignavibacteriales bacterium]|nr:peroxiredoxin [Ignavibacteriales bacterium]
MLKPGDNAPDFALPATDGSIVKLKDLRGKQIVLYFYSKDDTPGCTREACSFRDNLSALAKNGAVVLGVSADSVESHRRFTPLESPAACGGDGDKIPFGANTGFKALLAPLDKLSNGVNELLTGFTEKFELTFPLLSDEQRKVSVAYGVWQEKTFMGRKFKGIVRTTFVIDGQGKIKHVFEKVKVDGHTDEVLGVL